MICLASRLEPTMDQGLQKLLTYDGHRNLFSTYKEYNGGNVIFGSNLHGNIIGKGTISNDSLKINNVEHVDNLGFNWLSIGQICDNKCRVIFSKHDSEITNDIRVICRGIRKKGLYVMKLGNKPKDQICLATIDENSTLWHRRLGHANMHLIQSLASKELVRNLPKLKFDQHFCDACKIGKQAHASHKAKNIVSTTRCLELIHMDLFGPSAVRSYRGNRYTLVIVDDYSRLVAQGYNQQEGIDYDETYASVARPESIRILLVYACALDFITIQWMDKSAFQSVLSRVGACVFTDRWRLDELAYGIPSDGPYQTNPPSIEDIISSIRIDREGQVRASVNEDEMMFFKYQILTVKRVNFESL
ncbi:retrovirus-related pol polyprotein from transposon TNT 1-94 [Tanacetum coccineum]